MKTAQTLTTAAALLCALPASVVALSKVETRNLDIAEDDASRGLMHLTVAFKDECLHKHKDVCIAAINAKLAEHPELFEGREAFEFEVNKVREATDEGYNIVAMRLNADETTVGGLLGDGMIWYPYDWCLAADDCYTVGPWDCDVGIPLLPEQCCKMIQDSVPHEDMNGNYLECYTEFPVGSPSNPINPGRVCIHTDADGIVVHIPKNE
mmetsp:Transcript_11266/g.16918  ORF Transcript_11266/g.16918 Transcript_11266/m.16918 type:complete len:209 (-) Transcript_11266:212-838(-)